jgi:hypothetical protein
VPFNRKAWHAGPSKYTLNGVALNGLNDHSIGIEISNIGCVRKMSNGLFLDPYGNFISPDGKFDKTGRHIPDIVPLNEWHIQHHPRLGHSHNTYAWEAFQDDQLEALDKVVVALLKKYPTIQAIVSHEEIDTRGWKTDPGPMFPMRRYTKMTESRADDEKTHFGDKAYADREVVDDEPPRGLRPESLRDEAPAGTKWPRRMRATANVNVRSVPRGPVVAILAKGTEVAAYDRTENGRHIQIYHDAGNKKRGWVWAEYLEELNW